MQITLETEYTIAKDSPDHLTPWGTSRDNSKNPRFNLKFIELFSSLNRQIKVLDLGCSGGGFIKNCLDDGCLAVGLEGSDYSRRHCRAEWPALDNKFLFTSDITKPFQVLKDNKALQFDLITAWEVMEHLPEKTLDSIFENIKSHLEPHGLLIVSISPFEEIIRGEKLHLTVQNKSWWTRRFEKSGLFFMPNYLKYFNHQYVRGPKQSAPGSFLLILSKDPKKALNVPRLTVKQRVLDFWYASNTRKKLVKFIGSPI